MFDNDNNEAPFSRYATGPQPHLRVLATQDTARLVGTAHHRGPHVDVADAILVHDRVWLILSDAAPGSDARDAKQLEGFTVTAHAALRGIDARLYERLHPQTEPP